MAQALTPQQKEQKKARDNLKLIHNQILSAFSFGKIKTWKEFYSHLGLENKGNGDNITYAQLKEELNRQREELESRLRGDRGVSPSGNELSQQEIKDEASSVRKDATTPSPSNNGKEVSVRDGQQSGGNVPDRAGEVNGPERKTAPTVELKLEAKNDYGLPPSPNEKAFLYWFQKKAASEILTKIKEGKTGILLLAGTGTGKTFITYAVMRRLLDVDYHEDRTYSHIPYCCFSKATIIEQHWRVAKNFFCLTEADCEITNIEALRSKAGQLWVKEETYIENGEEKSRWVWKKGMQPCVIFLDESQGVKNKKATQSQIIYKYNELPSGQACLVCISATPFTRVIEAKAFAVSTHRPLEHLGFPLGTKLTNETWGSYAAIISSPSKPDEYNQAAVERLMADLEEYVVRVRGVRPQFDADNKVKIIQFETPQKRAFYLDAWERFLRDMAKLKVLEEAGDSSVGTCRLVILLKFAMAAELCHADHMADSMYQDVKSGKLAAVAAVKFKQTLIQIVKILNEKYGVPRDQISLVWGGGQTQLTKKQKAKQKIREMADKLKAMGMEVDELISDTGLEEVEDRVLMDLPEHLRLGPQDMDERQEEIDKFQSGKSLYCIYTLKAGGVGLSLHHTDEFTKFKCRRKESGYAVEEDIPKVPVRQRKTYCTVSYNAIELVQGVGRVPRLTSLSPTEQHICCYADTVEMDMGRIYSAKLRCLSSIVKQKEDWQSIIFGGTNRQRQLEEALRKTEGVANDESTIIDEGDAEDEDEESNGNDKA